MAIQTTSGTTTANVLGEGIPLVGGDQQGANLIIRSTNSPVKGSVVFDENTPSFGPNSGAVQLNGGLGTLNNVSVGGQFINMPNGYSVNNIMVPAGLGGDYRGFLNLVPISAGSWSAGITTVTYPTQNTPPFIVGQIITVTGVSPAAYNGNWQVISCSQTQVTWNQQTTPGSFTTPGYITQPSGGNTQPSITATVPLNTQSLINSSFDTVQATAVMSTGVYNVQTVASTGVVTVTVPAGSTPPFVVGQYVNVANVTPTAYNGQYQVTACTVSSTTATITMGSNPGTGTVGFTAGVGTISSGYVVGTNIINPGTGYNQPPQIGFSDPVPSQFVNWFAQMATQNAVGVIPQTIATSSSSGTGPISTQVTALNVSATANGVNVTVTTASNLYVGQPVTISGATGSGGLTNGTWYISYATGSTINLATSLQNALWNNSYTFTSASLSGVSLTSQLPSYVTTGFLTVGYSALSGSINVIPFYPGQQITIQGTVNNGTAPSSINATWTVWYATTTSVVISSSINASLTTQGVITTSGQQVPTMYIKAPGTGGVTNYYQVTYPGYLSASAPTHTYGTVLNGTAGLLYVGQVAQGYASLGYSGIITQGAIHQVGCVTNIIITNVGSGYGNTGNPSVVLSRPDLPGGRQAMAMATVNSSGNIATVTVIDQGSGYLYPPTVTFISSQSAGTGAAATAVISNPGEKPIVSTLVPAVVSGTAANAFYLDFGLTGHNVAFLTTGANSTVYFDNLVNSGGTPYLHGFPQGRRIILYVKATAGITVTFPNLQAGNAGTSLSGTGGTITVTSGHTAKCEFIVLSQNNTLNQSGNQQAGGTIYDVYATFTLT